MLLILAIIQRLTVWLQVRPKVPKTACKTRALYDTTLMLYSLSTLPQTRGHLTLLPKHQKYTPVQRLCTNCLPPSWNSLPLGFWVLSLQFFVHMSSSWWGFPWSICLKMKITSSLSLSLSLSPSLCHTHIPNTFLLDLFPQHLSPSDSESVLVNIFV